MRDPELPTTVNEPPNGNAGVMVVVATLAIVFGPVTNVSCPVVRLEVVERPPQEMVFVVLMSGQLNVSADSLELNVVQSEVESSPLFEALAVGRLKVIVEPEPVMVKSVPAVDEAKVTAGPVVVWPVGPIEVRAEVR